MCYYGTRNREKEMTGSSVDIEIGKKLRQLRNIKGLSQDALAKESGITFQQVQKYEKGVNRISAARLYDFAKTLGTDVVFFFRDLDNAPRKTGEKKYTFAENDAEAFLRPDIFESKETVILIREYYKIKDQSKRKHILEIIKAMSEK
jgi:transcriptional regulator with XRE-family HTH domain